MRNAPMVSMSSGARSAAGACAWSRSSATSKRQPRRGARSRRASDPSRAPVRQAGHRRGNSSCRGLKRSQCGGAAVRRAAVCPPRRRASGLDRVKLEQPISSRRLRGRGQRRRAAGFDRRRVRRVHVDVLGRSRCSGSRRYGQVGRSSGSEPGEATVPWARVATTRR
jgi:hypothetical protein